MAKERLSKLQKWILNKTHNELSLIRKDFREYFNKKERAFRLKCREIERIEPYTTSERVTIHRTLKNMLEKELIEQGKYGNFVLTEKGFNLFLNANKSRDVTKNVSFKEYQDRQQKDQAEFKSYLEVLKAVLPRRRHFRKKKNSNLCNSNSGGIPIT